MTNITKISKSRITTFSLLAVTLLMAVTLAYAPIVRADDDDDDDDDDGDCTVTVNAPGSIQDAVDASSVGDVICLVGTFSQQVVIGTEDSGITLTAGSVAVLDGSSFAGTGPTTFSAIELLDGVTDVTIDSLTIKNWKGDGGLNDRSSAIVAADGPTSKITVQNNKLNDNFWNGVLVFSEGDFTHSKWKLEDNDAADNGFVGIELTNCNRCNAKGNDVHGSGRADILVQARNTMANSGLLTIGPVEVEENNVGDSNEGIFVLAFAGNTNTFNPIAGASTLIKGLKIEENTVTDSTVAQIRLLAFNDGSTIKKAEIEDNELNCDPGDSAAGIALNQSGFLGEEGTIKKTEIEDNSIDSDCDPAIDDGGTNTEIDD